jgi:hypothetical protein
MLPDFSTTKPALVRHLRRFLNERVEAHMGPFADVPRSTYFEGDTHSVKRTPSQTESTSPFEEASSKLLVHGHEVPTLSLADIHERLDGIAQDVASQMAKYFYETIGQAVKDVGNDVKADGPITPELLLETLERLEINFDRFGQPSLPQIHVHPDMAQRLQGAIRQMMTDPRYREKYQSVLITQRESWRAREASRKLVG